MKQRTRKIALVAQRATPGPSPFRVVGRGHLIVGGVKHPTRIVRSFYTRWKRPPVTCTISLTDFDADNLRLALFGDQRG